MKWAVISWPRKLKGGKTEKEFSFRFRGKESRAYLQYFPQLIQLLLANVDGTQVRLRLHQVFFQSVHHRRVISLTVRIECSVLFKSWCLFEQRVSPSMWTLCNAVPVHAKHCLSEYNLGLGCNSMEAREQKHQRVEKYSQNTTVQCRWPMIFRHKYIQLIYLREKGYDGN